ncbi:hypothetical protein PITCH_A400027 [uncultured Desulfobacterium sp.]|uniref:Uncharacterized protein n=1 Tax=uncultured Desulfobacterium sp. TaxID=201089 RepID=A0A445N049_9BACT|nr:hypothetical protein PITCH_A400027 [uncultured Desulfobacterium sp.]
MVHLEWKSNENTDKLDRINKIKRILFFLPKADCIHNFFRNLSMKQINPEKSC